MKLRTLFHGKNDTRVLFPGQEQKSTQSLIQNKFKGSKIQISAPATQLSLHSRPTYGLWKEASSKCLFNHLYDLAHHKKEHSYTKYYPQKVYLWNLSCYPVWFSVFGTQACDSPAPVVAPPSTYQWVSEYDKPTTNDHQRESHEKCSFSIPQKFTMGSQGREH